MTGETRDESAAPEATIIPPGAAEPAARPYLAEATPPATPTATPTPASANTPARWALSLLALALLLVAFAPFWAPPLLPLLPWGTSGQDLAPQVKALQARLDAAEAARRGVEDRVARLEAKAAELAARPVAAPPTDPSPALATLGARIDALERRPDPGADSVAASAQMRDELRQLSARLADAEARLGRLAATAAAGDSPDRMLVLAVAQLRAALAGSGPFDGALAAVAALGHGDAEVETALKPLGAAAATGIPSRELLAQRFAAETAPAIRAAATARAQESADWGTSILARIRALVVIRRVDSDGGAGDDPAVARAQAALRAGDLAAAVAALKPLSGAPAQAASSWLESAGERLAAEHGLDALARQVASRVAAAPAAADKN